MSLLDWINDGLLTVFFLVVGLEIKRELTVGHLSGWRSAALPIAAAIGGMVAPALFYLAIIPPGRWTHGWGVPMSTDTAFAVALIVMLGQRVPIELRIFVTAAAIVDDLGAIFAVAAYLRRIAAPLSAGGGRLRRRFGGAQPVARLYAFPPYVAVRALPLGPAFWRAGCIRRLRACSFASSRPGRRPT